MKGEKSRYEARGVSSSKGEVHKATANLDKGLFPGAFCKLVPDISGRKSYCYCQHTDGAGTKAGLAYLAWKNLQDINVWRGVVLDSIRMNTNDLGCVGALGPYYVSMSIDRNKMLIPGEVIEVLISETQAECERLSRSGISCILMGGETADVGDLVRTITINHTVSTRMKCADVIDASRISAPAYIVGFSTCGKSFWEEQPNSGMGSNGLTNARHDTLGRFYRKFTETFSPEVDPKQIYCGSYRLMDSLPGGDGFTIGSALLSPTRDYLPLLQCIFDNIARRHILGIIHCSGGGQTKIGKFGHKGLFYIKDNLFPVPPLFQMLKQVRHLPWREMYSSYNMGHRLEIIVADRKVAEEMIFISEGVGINAQIVGEVRNGQPDKRQVSIIDPTGIWYNYEF